MKHKYLSNKDKKYILKLCAEFKNNMQVNSFIGSALYKVNAIEYFNKKLDSLINAVNKYDACRYDFNININEVYRVKYLIKDSYLINIIIDLYQYKERLY